MHESWTEAVSVIAHDLKTPITSIKGYLELMTMVGTLNDRQQQFSDRALHSLQHMERLIALLLELSWIDADRPLDCDDCDVGALLRGVASALEDMAARREVTLHLEIAPDLGVIPAEIRRLEQVMFNLLNNAIKYNRPGGEVWVKAHGTAEGVTVSFRDTGEGIAAGDQQHLFERFFRVRAQNREQIEGTGLGLSIVKAVIEKHGGTVALESSVGVGSTFRVWLPRVRAGSCE